MNPVAQTKQAGYRLEISYLFFDLEQSTGMGFHRKVSTFVFISPKNWTDRFISSIICQFPYKFLAKNCLVVFTIQYMKKTATEQF